MLQRSISQQDFAALIGVSEAKVSQLVADGVLARGASGHGWLLAYCERLREVAAGRASEGGGLDLVQERAALAREQRLGHEIRNAIARGEYAPVSLLSEALALASQAVVDQLDQLPAMLKKSCPDLPDAAREQVMAAIAGARNAWVSGTHQLVVRRLSFDDGDDSADVGEA